MVINSQPPGLGGRSLTVRLQQARDQVTLLTRDDLTNRDELSTCRKLRTLFSVAAPAAAVVALGSLAVGAAVTAVAAGCLAGVLGCAALMAPSFVRHNEKKVAECQQRLAEASLEVDRLQQALLSSRNQLPPSFERPAETVVEQLAGGLQGGGGGILHGAGFLDVAGVRTRTRS